VSDGPRPEFGEYASPEEQARAIARSQPDAAPASGAPGPPTPPPPARGPAATAAAPTATGGPLDRIVTVLLLAIGLVYLIGGVGGYLDLPTTLDTVYAQFGIGSYTPTAATPAFGIAFLASQSLIWIAVAFWSYRRLSRGRRSWWVPVLGAVATFLVSVVLFGVLLGSDPAFLAYVSSA